MRANCSGSSACPANSSEEELPVGLQVPGNLELVFTVVSAVMMGLLMFSLGCSVEIRKLWLHVRRPWGIAVGLLCQFGLMPLIAYLLVVTFSLKPIHAIAVLIMGCCPGGTISNIFTFWVDGDMDLSISMTTCSTVAALGMMPLCLYLYTLSWNLEQNFIIPYQNIGISLVCLTIPVAFGVYVNYRWTKQSKIILKIGAIVGGVLLLVVTVAGVVLAKESWNPDLTLLTISFIFPSIGHVTGFLLALLTHHSWQRCRTISLETGAQNIQLCITMLQLSFTAEQLVQMLSFPLAYGLFQLLDGILIVAGWKRGGIQTDSCMRLTGIHPARPPGGVAPSRPEPLQCLGQRPRSHPQCPGHLLLQWSLSCGRGRERQRGRRGGGVEKQMGASPVCPGR